MFVVLEGIENSGKTTIIELLCSKFNIVKKMELPKFTDEIKEIFGQYKTGTHYELSDNQIKVIRGIKKAEYIENFKNEKNEILIVTSYYPSDIAFAKFTKMDSDINDKLKEILPQPDCKIYLEVSPENSVRRSGSTNCIGDEKRLSSLRRLSSSFQEIVNEDSDWYIINTNELDEYQVCESVEKIIEELFKIG